MANLYLQMELPDDILKALHIRPEQLGNEIRFWAAASLFRANKLSIGRAAKLAGMHRLDFENKLAENKIPISNLDASDAEKEWTFLS